MKVRITEYLEMDLAREKWCCQRCGQVLAAARENYKTGCLVAEVPLDEVHDPLVEAGTFSFCPDPAFCRLIEFYCPNCGTMIENEYLPPGHPLTHDIELDVDALKEKHGQGRRVPGESSQESREEVHDRGDGTTTGAVAG